METVESFSKNLKSVDQIAAERKWPPKRIRRLIDEGLPTVKIGRQNFINSMTLDRFLKDREPVWPPSSTQSTAHYIPT